MRLFVPRWGRSFAPHLDISPAAASDAAWSVEILSLGPLSDSAVRGRPAQRRHLFRGWDPRDPNLQIHDVFCSQAHFFSATCPDRCRPLRAPVPSRDRLRGSASHPVFVALAPSSALQPARSIPRSRRRVLASQPPRGSTLAAGAVSSPRNLPVNAPPQRALRVRAVSRASLPSRPATAPPPRSLPCRLPSQQGSRSRSTWYRIP